MLAHNRRYQNVQMFLPGRGKFWSLLLLYGNKTDTELDSLPDYSTECVCGVTTGHSLQPPLAPVDKEHLLNPPTCSLPVQQPGNGSSSELRTDHQTADLNSSLKPPNPLGSLKGKVLLTEDFQGCLCLSSAQQLLVILYAQ